MACASTNAFTVIPSQGVTASQTSLQMGVFDFFSAEAREARELKKQKEIEEQERLQKIIRERRNDPAKMEEYEAKIRVRRQLRMQGRDEDATKVELYENIEDQTLLDGTKGL
eukprot:CAMPEP_0195264068 /NCGR_PEP_ID=MMETSP0706-20130129/10649_1 /TAXON_ID=33640 /ORGANISM="Asterionellopsis glacialis, Strain CCMP134" /LENGTH=111 /DNA_ID=CAMNT_0040318307 /DNA_START=89 /DNA_END=424 /DNA_ORIENTATION=-